MSKEETEAEKEAKREAKRNAIRAKIASINTKTAHARGLVNRFRECKTSIGNWLGEWGVSYGKYQGSAIAFQVRMTDIFEGIIAEHLDTAIPETVELMTGTRKNMGDVKNAVDIQIGKIQEYITQLEAERNALETELAFI